MGLVFNLTFFHLKADDLIDKSQVLLLGLIFSGHVEKASEEVDGDCFFVQAHTSPALLLRLGKEVGG